MLFLKFNPTTNVLLALPLFYGEDGVWYSMPISDFVAAVLTIVMLKVQFDSWSKKKLI